MNFRSRVLVFLLPQQVWMCLCVFVYACSSRYAQKQSHVSDTRFCLPFGSFCRVSPLFIRQIVHQHMRKHIPVHTNTHTMYALACTHTYTYVHSAKAGATCLRLIAQLVEDDVVDYMVPFVTENIASQTNWRQREAAVMAFGAVLEVSCTSCLVDWAKGTV